MGDPFVTAQRETSQVSASDFITFPLCLKSQEQARSPAHGPLMNGVNLRAATRLATGAINDLM